jgi:localization factor PodJL
MRHVPWHVKGVRPEVREVARDAARRSGLSVGAWLNSLIVDAVAHQDAPPDRYHSPAPLSPVARTQPTHINDVAFAAIRKDIDEFKRQMARPQVEPAIFEQRLREIEARINALQSSTRCDDVVEALRQHFAEIRGTLKEVAPPIEEIAKVWRQDLMAISAALRDAMPTSAVAALEKQVRALGERLEAHRGSEAAIPAVADIEHTLAGIRDRLQALTPAEELTELSHAVKLLTRKADSIATQSAAPEKMQQLEHAIGALQSLASQVASRDVVAALSHDIKALGDKIDRNSRPAVDPAFMDTLERRLAEIAEAVGRCRPAEGASVPANFDTVIKELADRLEAAQIPAIDPELLKSLEQRMDMLADKLESSEIRPDRGHSTNYAMDELLAQLKELRAQNENKFVAIQQQLAADTISGPAESIRRDVASLKEIQTSVDRRTQDTFAAGYGTIDQVVDGLASFEDGLRDGQYVPLDVPLADPSADSSEWRGEPAGPQIRFPAAMVAKAPSLVPSAAPAADHAAIVPAIKAQGTHAAKPPLGILSADPPAAIARLRHPAVSDLAPDVPLEPGSGVRRVQVVANAIDRIAASEAVNGAAKPAAPVRANFVAAARRAAQAVASEHAGTPAARFENTGQKSRSNFQTNTLLGRLRSRIKSVALGVSAILLVFGALGLALDLFYNPGVPEPPRPVTRMDTAIPPDGESVASMPEPPPLDQPPIQKGASLESPTLPAPLNTSTFPGEITLGQVSRSGVLPDEATLAAIPRPAATGIPAAIPATAAGVPPVVAFSAMRNPLLQAPAGRGAVPQSVTPSAASARDLTEMPLPPTIGGKALIAAASAGEPGASYEVAVRFAQGRNTPQNLAMAAAWFERAARSGLAPAQFRLGSMYEKGLGIKKDLSEARRLYLAAADKGNEKAMHNLAVLYAEGLDGKPDYAVASQWFRRAATHGIIDSQYNLAILYARGVGVERYASESYKWFALAAKGGDKDAAKKRDEIAVRLDPKQLESAKLNVESFITEPQPDEATAPKAPAGGWDQVVATATTRSKAAR